MSTNETFGINYSEMEGTASALKTSSNEITDLFDEYKTTFIQGVKDSYGEGTDICENIIRESEKIFNEAVAAAQELESHSGKATTTLENAQDTEQKSVNTITTNMGDVETRMQ